MASEDSAAGTDRPERRLIGSKLSARHVLERGEEIEPGVYRIEYEDDATVVCEFAYNDNRGETMSEPYCAVCRRTVTPDGEHVEVEVVTDPREEPWGTTYYFHRSCWTDADPTDEWGEPA